MMNFSLLLFKRFDLCVGENLYKSKFGENIQRFKGDLLISHYYPLKKFGQCEREIVYKSKIEENDQKIPKQIIKKVITNFFLLLFKNIGKYELKSVYKSKFKETFQKIKSKF